MISLLTLELKLKSQRQAEGNEVSQCPERGTAEIPHPYLSSLPFAVPVDLF